MTRDQFIYALTACGCLLKDGKTWYEHNELIKCFEDLGLFEQEPQKFKWCTDCREYDQEKHCCHRWSKVIRDTVEEMKQEQEPKIGHWINTGAYFTGAYESIDYVECSCCHYESLEEGNYCPNCGAKMESEVDNGNVDN